MLFAKIEPYTLKFAFRANTSRESFTEKKTYFISVYDDSNPEIKGRGEIPPFPSLQPSFISENQFIEQLEQLTEDFNSYATGKLELPQNSAIRFGVETALTDLKYGGVGCLNDDGKLRNIKDGIIINGLIWMNDAETMTRQIHSKIEEGFKCLKLKIGNLNFEKELAMLGDLRSTFNESQLTVRLDANGAFSPSNVLHRLNALSKFGIHSIEQPLPRDSSYMKETVRLSPVRIALDEDMIERWWPRERKTEWLCEINPAYIVLKPSLAGGFKAADEWIEIAEANGIGWWATSALESNVGLSAIAQWLSGYPHNLDIPHGLGTGKIYTNNIPAPITLKNERLYVSL